MTENKWLRNLLLLGTSCLVGAKIYKEVQHKRKFSKLDIPKKETQAIPTIMLHGTNGTRRSMGGMIDRWKRKGWAYKALDVEVSETGKVNITGQWQDVLAQKNPLIHVIFKNTTAEEWQQSEWLKKSFETLLDHLALKRVNIVGHSVGGVAALRYLLEYGSMANLPKINKFVSIGAPFNGESVHSSGRTMYDLAENGPKNYVDSYRYFKTYRNNIPKDIKILNIFGDVANGSRSDGLVSIDSAKSLRYLVKDRVKFYKETEIVGLQAQHVLLHENTQVDRMVANFLWD